MEEVFSNEGPCEICLGFYQKYFLPMAHDEFQAHIYAKHGGSVPEDVIGIVKWSSRHLESHESDDESEEDVAATLNKMISNTLSNNTPASSQISSAQQDSCPTHIKHETIEPSKVKIRASPSTRLFDSRSNAKTNGEQQLPSVPELPWNSTRLRSEQKAKTWVVKENKEEPWNMEKVLEELGEVEAKDKPTARSSKNKRKKFKHLKRNQDQKTDCKTLLDSYFGPEVTSNSESNCQNDIEQPIASTSNKIKRNNSKKIEKIDAKKDDTIGKRTKSTGLEANIESDCLNTVENASSPLSAMSLAEKVPKDEDEKIPLEVLQYFENVEQENNKFKNEICPTMEKIMEKFEARNKEFEKLEIKNKELEKLEIKNKELEERNLCKICLVAEICYVFVPCGHGCTCENCALNRDLKNCPICREKITTRMKIYLS